MHPKENKGLKDQIWFPVFGNVFKRPHRAWLFGQIRSCLLLIALNYLPHASQTLSLLSLHSVAIMISENLKKN